MTFLDAYLFQWSESTFLEVKSPHFFAAVALVNSHFCMSNPNFSSVQNALSFHSILVGQEWDSQFMDWDAPQCEYNITGSTAPEKINTGFDTAHDPVHIV